MTMAEEVDLDAVAEKVHNYANQMIEYNAETTMDGIETDSYVKEINAYTGKPGQVVIPQ
jgi:hypothetical protein